MQGYELTAIGRTAVLEEPLNDSVDVVIAVEEAIYTRRGGVARALTATQFVPSWGALTEVYGREFRQHFQSSPQKVAFVDWG
jgi:hypothetical protein